MALTIEALYEAYMDEGDYADDPKDFALDIWEFFAPPGAELTGAKFKQQYGMYLPTYDPTKAHLAFQDKALSFEHAADNYSIAKAATDRVYSEEMQKVSGGLQEDIAKGREIAGGIGLRTGSLESALEDTMTTATNKATNLGDRLDIQQEETLNTYNQKVSDATLDYERDIHETKEELYNRVMASIARLTSIGAFRQLCGGEPMCWNGECPVDGECPEEACESQPGMVTCGQLGCLPAAECPSALDELTVTNCEADPTLPECEGFTDPIQDGEYIGPTTEMCQADPSLEGCGGEYDTGVDLNLGPDDYNTCPPGYSGTYPNCYSISADGFSCTDPVCVAALWVAKETGFDIMQAGSIVGEFLFGDKSDPCWTPGAGSLDNPCPPGYVGDCVETADENGCRSCECAGEPIADIHGDLTGTGLVPSGYCLSDCPPEKPFQCAECNCSATYEGCFDYEYPTPFN